jgi:acid stress-induced BolA-like protein IbaG/YrbA
MTTTLDAIREAIATSLAATEVDVRGGDGGHFEIAVVASAFEGKSTLERHRMVLNAIKELMAGPNAPVHAVDTIKTSVG